MKKAIFILLVGLLLSASLYAYDDDRQVHRFSGSHKWYGSMLDNIDVDIDGGDILMIEKGRDRNKVVITKDHQLIINGKKVKLDDDQQKKVIKFHDLTFALIDYAKEVGIEGAKIGVAGAAVGLEAVVKLFKLLDSEYDTEDYEREIEAKADAISRSRL